jgi:hypothetical protein
MNGWQDKPDTCGFWWALLPSGLLTVAEVHSLDCKRGSEAGCGEVLILGVGWSFSIEHFQRWHKLDVPVAPTV